MIARLKPILLNLLFVIVSCWVALWIVEGMARLVFHGTLFAPASDGELQALHPTRGAALPAGKRIGMYQLAHAESATINSRGFRGAEVADAPPPGKFRILLLSDSNGFGSGVADGDTLAVRLQEQLGADQFEVLNFCVPAYSNVQEYLWLKEEGLGLKPNLVLFGFTPVNDIQTNYQSLQALFQPTSKRPYAVLAPTGGFSIDDSFMQGYAAQNKGVKPLNVLRDIFAGKMVQRLVDQGYERLTGGRKADPNIWIGWPFLASFSEQLGPLKVADYEKLWADAWAVTQQLILGMKAESEAAGAKFVMFSHVGKIEGDPQHLAALQAGYPGLAFDVGRAERELRNFADAHGISMISSTAAVKAESGLYYGIDDDHMNAKGYQVVAKALADDLRKQGLVPAN